MKLVLKIIISFILVMNTGYSQDFNWASSLNGPFVTGISVYNEDISVDLNGNVYVIGNFSDTITIGTTQLQGPAMYIAKYDKFGALVLAKNANKVDSLVPSRADISCDNSGNFYITGIYSNPTKMFVSKYNSSGTHLWTTTSTLGASSDVHASFTSVDNAGNCYVAGSFAGTFTVGSFTLTNSGLVGFSDVFIAKFSSATGTCLWAKSGGSDRSEETDGIAIDPANNVFLAARFTNPTSSPGIFNTVTVNNTGFTRFFVKYSGDGNSIIGKEYSTGAGISQNAIGIDQNLQIYLLDRFGILKFDSQLNPPQRIWTADLNLNLGGMDTDLNGNCYVLGRLNFQNENAVKINSHGDVVWTTEINRVSGGNVASDICADRIGGSAYLTGDYSGTSVFGDITLTAAIPASAYVTKISSSPLLTLTVNFEACAETDTILVELRTITPPYNVIETVKGLGGLGISHPFTFSNASDGTRYYIVVKMRNSIETWSKSGGEIFTAGALTYDFTTAATQAFGNNEVLVGSDYSLYTGDIEQNGLVDLTDIIAVFNDAANFVTGYVVTDLNCDDAVTLTDLLYAYNNATNFVSIKRP